MGAQAPAGPGDPGPMHAPPRLAVGSGVVRGRHTLPSGGPWGPDLCPEAWVGADARVSPLPCAPGASLGWGLLVSGASARLGVEGEGSDSVARTPLLSFQPAAQGAFLRGSGLSLASGRFTAPVTAIFQFFASLHVGERGRARVHVGRGGWPSGCAPGPGPIAEASPARTLTPLGAGRVLTPTLPNPQCAPKPPSPCPRCSVLPEGAADLACLRRPQGAAGQGPAAGPGHSACAGLHRVPVPSPHVSGPSWGSWGRPEGHGDHLAHRGGLP